MSHFEIGYLVQDRTTHWPILPIPGGPIVKMDFADAVREVEEEEILEASRLLQLDRESREYVLARHRRSAYTLDVLLAMGGSVADFVRMTIEARPPSSPPAWRRYR